ncbi:hypothetical protein OAA27_01925 [bacterium]|nr:hypothetical protein [bacterium]
MSQGRDCLVLLPRENKAGGPIWKIQTHVDLLSGKLQRSTFGTV